MKRQQTQLTDLYCTECGTLMPIQRKSRKQRELGHLKKLYCYKCNKETNFAEVKENSAYNKEVFLLEFQYGNFENGNRKMSTKQFLSDLKNRGVIE